MIKGNIRRRLAAFLTMVLVATSVQGVAWADADAGTSDRAVVVNVDSEGLIRAAEEARQSGTPWRGEAPAFLEAETSEDGDTTFTEAGSYSSLFNTESGPVYELDSLGTTTGSMPEGCELKVFVKLDKAADQTETAFQGNEQFIFLLENRSEYNLSCTLNVDGAEATVLNVDSDAALMESMETENAAGDVENKEEDTKADNAEKDAAADAEDGKESDADTGAEDDGESESGTDASAEDDKESESGTDASAEDDKESESGTDASAEDDKNAESGTDASVEDDKESESGTDAGAEDDKNSESGTDAGAEDGENAESGMDSGADTNTSDDNEADVTDDATSDSDSDSAAAAEMNSEGEVPVAAITLHRVARVAMGVPSEEELGGNFYILDEDEEYSDDAESEPVQIPGSAGGKTVQVQASAYKTVFLGADAAAPMWLSMAASEGPAPVSVNGTAGIAVLRLRAGGKKTTGIIVSRFDKIDKELSIYEVPGDSNFLVLKKGDQKNYIVVWTESELSLSQQSSLWEKIKLEDGSTKNVPLESVRFISGFKEYDLNDESAGVKNWGSWTISKRDGKIYVSSEAGIKLSHLNYGFATGIDPDPEPQTTEVTVTKEWIGGNPSPVQVLLMKDDKKYEAPRYENPVTLSTDSSWKHTFADLPMDGRYTVKEITDLEDYSVNITRAGNNFTITNKFNPTEEGKTSISVKKVWTDGDNQDGRRPESITVKLWEKDIQADKITEVSGVEDQVLSTSSNWMGHFMNLPVLPDGYRYVVTETNVPEGYKPTITGDAADGFTITNIHEPETVDIKGQKTWDDNNNQDGKRPESITVRLLADGIEVDHRTISVASESNWIWENLPKYEKGEEIRYTVTEDAVADYTPTINGYDITNTYTPGKTSISVRKVWDDENDKDKLRPDSVTVHLLADGNIVEQADVVLNAENLWQHTYDNLDECRDGEKIVYSVQEAAVANYTPQIAGNAVVGFTITNKHVPKTPDKPDDKPDKPDDKPDKPDDKPDKPDDPHNGNSGRPGGNPGGPSGSTSGSNGGPGVPVTIAESPVPMAPAPIVIEEEPVPMAGLPKMGDSRSGICYLMGSISALLLALIWKRKEED